MVSDSESLVLAADIGGTTMRAALVDVQGSVIVRRSLPTPAHADAPAALVDLIRNVHALAGRRVVGHAVVGLPGAVEYDAGRLLWAPHLPESWPELLSSDALTSRLGLSVLIANDADLAAVGEATYGNGARTRDVVYLTISTGIGAGIVYGGQLVRGRRSIGEVGHTVIDWQAWCAGRPSTLEELGSGSGMARQAAEAGLGDIDARLIFEAVSKGDRRAREIWARAVAACAAGVCNLVMTFSPSVVIIGGGIGRQQDFFEAVRTAVAARPERHPADLSIVISSLGGDAGLAGAAAWMAATSSHSRGAQVPKGDVTVGYRAG